MKYAIIILGLTAAALAQQHSTVPVVLVDDSDFTGSCINLRKPTANFGQLAQILASDSGQPTAYWDICSTRGFYGGLASSNTVAEVAYAWPYLAKVLTDTAAKSKSGLVDVVAFGTGGIYLRAYLAGLFPPICCGSTANNPHDHPALSPPIRKLVMIGVPNFGIDTQAEPLQMYAQDHGAYWTYPPINLPSIGLEILPGSSTIWKLATWNQRGDDWRGLDAIAIAGNGGGDVTNANDGLVSVNSASVTNAWSDWDQRTRVIPYCHGTIMVGPCSGDYLTNVQDSSHPTYQIIRSFLDNTPDWQSIGLSASQASHTGGVIASMGALIGCLSGNEGGGDVCGHWPTLGFGITTDSAGMIDSFTGKKNAFTAGPPMLPGAGTNTFYWDFVRTDPKPLVISYNDTVWNGDDNYGNWAAPRRIMWTAVTPGTWRIVFDRVGYYINDVPVKIQPMGIIPAAGAGRARSLNPGTLISIYGSNLAPGLKAPASSPNPVLQIGGTSVRVYNGEVALACPVTYVSSGRIDCLLSASTPLGWNELEVDTSRPAGDAGTDTVTIMVEQPAQ
jgi:hypothetical protein